MDQDVKKLLEFVNATHVSSEPVYQGTATQLTPVLQKVGKFVPMTKEIDVPGWLDDLARVIKAGSTVLFRQNAKGEVVPARWYEYLEDGSVDMVLGAYLNPILEGGNALLTAGERGHVRARNTIDSIQKAYPTSSISTSDFAEKMFKTEMEKTAEVEKERIRNTPISLKYKKGAEEGEIQVIPAALSNYPWFNLGGGYGGRNGGGESTTTPEEAGLGGLNLGEHIDGSIAALDAYFKENIVEAHKRLAEYGIKERMELAKSASSELKDFYKEVLKNYQRGG